MNTSPKCGVRIDVLTLFPEMFKGILSSSMLKIALEKNLVEINIVNIRDFSRDKHKKVDAPPYGGGPGMVMMCDPVFRAVKKVSENSSPTIVLLTPSGKRLEQETAWKLSKEKHLVLLCGHYEGFDERIRKGLNPLEISVGDYVLTGGEIPAMIILDSVVRLCPGVLGCPDSLKEESFTSGLLEYPHYTRPRVYKEMSVPEVLCSGNHKEIAKWRKEMAKKITKIKRPDLVK